MTADEFPASFVDNLRFGQSTIDDPRADGRAARAALERAVVRLPVVPRRGRARAGQDLPALMLELLGDREPFPGDAQGRSAACSPASARRAPWR